MFDIAGINDEEQQDPLFYLRRPDQDMSGFHVEPLRPPADVGAIDVPKIGAARGENDASAAGDTGSSGARQLSMGGPTMAGPNASSNIATRKQADLSIAGPNDDQLGIDQRKLTDLKTRGSPISRIHNPFLRGMAHVGDTLASTFLPGYAAMPWTDFKHNSDVRGREHAVAEDLGEQKEEAQTEQERAKAVQERAAAQRALNPPANVKEEQLLYDKNGQPIGYRDEQGKYWSPQELAASTEPQHQSISQILTTAQPKQPAVKEGEMPLGDRVGQLNKMLESRYQVLNPGQALPAQYQLPAAATQKDYDRIDKGLEAEERSKGTKAQQDQVNEMRRQTLELARANSEERTREHKEKVVATIENRASLANNMNENLDRLEEIVKRRPDLFGPFAGRLTEMKMGTGSGDPDIGALDTLKEQLGMVQQSAHGMRAAYRVEAAAKSILNLHNQPAAVLAAIQTARNSVATFVKDAGRAEEGGGGHVIDLKGKQYRYKGIGDTADINNYEEIKKETKK